MHAKYNLYQTRCTFPEFPPLPERSFGVLSVVWIGDAGGKGGGGGGGVNLDRARGQSMLQQTASLQLGAKSLMPIQHEHHDEVAALWHTSAPR